MLHLSGDYQPLTCVKSAASIGTPSAICKVMGCDMNLSAHKQTRPLTTDADLRFLQRLGISPEPIETIFCLLIVKDMEGNEAVMNVLTLAR